MWSQISRNSPSRLKVWIRSFSRSATSTRSPATQSAWGTLNWPGPLPSWPPGGQQFALRREAVDASIAVAVGDVDVAVRRDSSLGRPVEWRTHALDAGRSEE